jgi:hypothetical protein
MGRKGLRDVVLDWYSVCTAGVTLYWSPGAVFEFSRLVKPSAKDTSDQLEVAGSPMPSGNLSTPAVSLEE